MADDAPPTGIPYSTLRADLADRADALAQSLRLTDRPKYQELAAIHSHLPRAVEMMVQVSATAFRACVHLIQCKNTDPYYVTAVPPVTRTLLDTLFVVVFTFDEPSTRAAWFIASAWREVEEKYLRQVQRHGNDPEWTTWLANLRAWIDEMKKEDVDAAVVAQGFKSVPYWPNPGKMLRKLKDPNRRARLEWLRDWYYGDLSGDSHLSYLGLMRRGAPFLRTPKGETPMVDKYRDNVVAAALFGMYVALLSEIAIELRDAIQARLLIQLWLKLCPMLEIRDIYEKWYRERLESLA